MLVVGAFDNSFRIQCSRFGLGFRSHFRVGIIQWFMLVELGVIAFADSYIW
jgi:hypothetical protein